MADTIHVPGVGNTKKKWVYIGGGAVVLIVGVAYMRYRKTASQAAATTGNALSTPATGGTQDQYPSDGTTGNPSNPYSVDPNTGVTYGDEGQQGGFYNQGYAPAGQSPAMGYDAYSGYGGYYYGNTNPTTNSTISTNEEWLTQAENDLQGVGYDQATAAAALSKILAGLPVTADQKDIFEQALGIDGNPPQGYKTPIRLVNTPAGHNPPPSSANMTTVPRVTGETASKAHNHLVADHLTPLSPGMPGSSIVTGTTPPEGTRVNWGTKVTIHAAPAPHHRKK